FDVALAAKHRALDGMPAEFVPLRRAREWRAESLVVNVPQAVEKIEIVKSVVQRLRSGHRNRLARGRQRGCVAHSKNPFRNAAVASDAPASLMTKLRIQRSPNASPRPSSTLKIVAWVSSECGSNRQARSFGALRRRMSASRVVWSSMSSRELARKSRSGSGNESIAASRCAA